MAELKMAPAVASPEAWLVCDRVRDELTALEPLLAHRLLQGAPRLVARKPEWVAHGGKRLRASLVLLAGSFGRRRQDLLSAAMIPELLHTGSLIQDDIMDRADKRRGAPALHRIVGAETASLFATRLYCAAFGIVTEMSVDVRARAVRAARDLCRGQWRELASQGNSRLSPAEYRRIVAGKTASLFAVSAWLGARISGASPRRVRALEGFGRRFGMLYQIVDDLLDLFGDEQAIGKPTGGDLERRVFTLPLVYWLAERAEHPSARRLLRGEALSANQSARLVSDLRSSAALARVLSDVETWTRGAEFRLSSLPQGPARESLRRLLLSVAGLPAPLVSGVRRRGAGRPRVVSGQVDRTPSETPGARPGLLLHHPRERTASEWESFCAGAARSLPWFGEGVVLVDLRIQECLRAVDRGLVERLRRHRLSASVAEGLTVVAPVLFGGGGGKRQVDVAVALALLLAAERGQRGLDADLPGRSGRILAADLMLCEFMAVLSELPARCAAGLARAAETYIRDLTADGPGVSPRLSSIRRRLCLAAWRAGVAQDRPGRLDAFAQEKIGRLLEAAERLERPGVKNHPSILRAWTEALVQDTCRLAGLLRESSMTVSLSLAAGNLK